MFAMRGPVAILSQVKFILEARAHGHGPFVGAVGAAGADRFAVLASYGLVCVGQ